MNKFLGRLAIIPGVIAIVSAMMMDSECIVLTGIAFILAIALTTILANAAKEIKG